METKRRGTRKSQQPEAWTSLTSLCKKKKWKEMLLDTLGVSEVVLIPDSFSSSIEMKDYFTACATISLHLMELSCCRI